MILRVRADVIALIALGLGGAFLRVNAPRRPFLLKNACFYGIIPEGKMCALAKVSGEYKQRKIVDAIVRLKLVGFDGLPHNPVFWI